MNPPGSAVRGGMTTFIPGDDPDCRHENSERTRIRGTGRDAVYEWHCPDCGETETEGYEGED